MIRALAGKDGAEKRLELKTKALSACQQQLDEATRAHEGLRITSTEELRKARAEAAAAVAESQKRLVQELELARRRHAAALQAELGEVQQAGEPPP